MKEEPDKGLAQHMLDLLRAGSGTSGEVGDLIVRYESQAVHDLVRCEIGLARADHTGRALTDRQERAALDSLLLALRQHTRTGGPVVTCYPVRARTRSTIAALLFTHWQWQSVPIGRIFNLSPDGHTQATRWIAAVNDREREDRKLLGLVAVEERQEVLL